MSAETAAYPKLFKIYKELKRQNEIIFEAEKERNAWEVERDDLKGLAKFIKKRELQSRIYHKSQSAYPAYREQEKEWEKLYGTDSHRQDKESVLERLKNPHKITTEYQPQRTAKSKDRGA